MDHWFLPRFDAEKLVFRIPYFFSDVMWTTRGEEIDIVGVEALDISTQDIPQAQEFKQACEKGTALLSAQALPILTRVLGGKKHGANSYKFIVLLFDVRFLDGMNGGHEYEGIKVAVGEPKLGQTDKGYSFPTGYSKKDRETFYSKFSVLLGQDSLKPATSR